MKNRCKYLQLTIFFIVISLNAFSNPKFTENKGQICDQYYKPRPDILYSGSANGLVYHLKKDGLHYQLSRVESWKEERSPIHHSETENKQVPDKIGMYRVDVNWLNTSPKTELYHGEALPGYDNYYNVPDGVAPALFVKSYKTVNYHNLYEGIDLKFYTDENVLEYDFIVCPFADYKQIKIQIKGAQLEVTPQKELKLITPFGNIIEGALKVYQGNKLIPANWVVNNNVVSFHIPNYDPSHPLRIDPPVRVWGTYYGSTNNDGTDWEYGKTVSTDPNGNVYMCGDTRTLNSAAIATAGSTYTSMQGERDAFLVKFDPNGQRLWGTYYGGSLEDYAFACSADANGNIFLAGESISSNNIATPGAFQTVKNTSYDAYLVKFNASGVRQWGTYYGGNAGDTPFSTAIDNSGNIIIAGTTGSTNVIATAGTYQPVFSGTNTEAFLAKFDTNGNRLWGTYFGGTGQENGYGCISDNAGNIFLVGTTNSTANIASAGANQTIYGGGNNDDYVAKFGPNGNRLWSTYIGGNQDDNMINRNCRPAVDANGNVFVTGWTRSTTGIATPGSFTPTYAGNPWDGFLQKYSPNGNLIWGTYFGSSGWDQAHSATSDASGNIYITGQTSSGTGIATAGVHQTTLGNTGDAFLAMFDNNGNRLWATYYGGTGNDEMGLSIAIHNASSSIYMSGTTNSTSSIATTGAHQTTFGGGYGDAFLVKFQDCPPTGNVTPTTNAPICAGQTLTLSAPASAGASYQWSGPNGFTSTLQNPTISNATTNASGTYNVTITANGCPGSSGSVNVTVNPSPGAPLANTLTPGVCRDSVATFQVTSTGTTFNWYATATSTTVLGTGTTFTSPPLTANASYFVERVENGCPSPRTQVFVQVIIAPDPTPANAQICAGTTATLNSNLTSGTVNWYNAPNATTAIFTGFSFTTPVLNANTTYYVQNFVNGCPSARMPVTVTVVTPPAAPTVSGTTICAGQTATLNATAPSGVTFAWFTTATGGTAVFTGNPFITPTLNNNTTYYVEAQSGSCNSATRTSVVVNVNPTPAAPTAAGTTICNGETATLNATAPANVTFNWYNTATGGTSLLNGASYTTPVLTANNTYYVDATSGNCTSTRTAVIVTVNQPPVQPVVAAVSICEGETAILNATAPVGATFNWYDAPNAGNLLQTGNSFTTPVLNTNTTYYVEAFNGCVSARTAVLVTVNTPPILPTVAGVTICSGQTASLTATAPAGVTFLWFSTPNGGSILSSGNIFTTQPLNNTTTFYVAAEAAGCPPSARTPVTVKVEPTPTEPVVNNTAICSGETATLTATVPTGVSFEWFADAVGGTVIENNASFTTTALTATTTYYVAAVLGNCASARVTVEVTVNQPPLLPNATNAAICEGETATLTATSSAGATINWYNDNSGSNLLFSGNDFTTPALTTNTSYFVQAEAVGCPPTNSVEVVVTVLPAPAAPLANDITICSGNTATLTATTADSAATIQWHDDISQGIVLGSGSIFTTAELLTTTTFYVSAQLGNCPSSQRTPVVVNVLPTPVAAFSSEPELTRTVMVSQANFTFSNNTTNGSRYVWSFGDGDSLETFNTQEVSHKYQQPGSYTVTLCAFTADGCSNCITYGNITVVEDYAIYIPNAFTPNGDGNNDVFQYHLIGVKQAYIFIFNRWGEKVFETDNPTEYWDGTYKGKLMNPDVYVYHIKLVSYDNKQAEFKGSVTIVR